MLNETENLKGFHHPLKTSHFHSHKINIFQQNNRVGITFWEIKQKKENMQQKLKWKNINKTNKTYL